VTALVNSLKRIWSARNRVPRQTGWGTPGSLVKEKKKENEEKTPHLRRTMEGFLELAALARRTAPTIVIVTLNIFR
jgi:hypothetical protein